MYIDTLNNSFAHNIHYTCMYTLYSTISGPHYRRRNQFNITKTLADPLPIMLTSSLPQRRYRVHSLNCQSHLGRASPNMFERAAMTRLAGSRAL